MWLPNIFLSPSFQEGRGFLVDAGGGKKERMAWLARFVVAVAFLALGSLFAPQPLISRLTDSHRLSHPLALRLAYLLCFASAWGMSLWVTFIGGVIMFKHLPRHQFGNLQSKLFPVYFGLLAVCAAVCLAIFVLFHPWKQATYTENAQTICLLISLLSTLSNILVFEPLTIKVMRMRHKIEREESIGNEVGISKNQEIAKGNPKLAEVNKKFGMVHGLSSLANLFSLGGLAVHFWYLAGKLDL